MKRTCCWANITDAMTDLHILCPMYPMQRWPAPECALALAWAPPAPWGHAQLARLCPSWH
eukprot:349668-Chlamydomonas_euryale.AAC.7